MDFLTDDRVFVVDPGSVMVVQVVQYRVLIIFVKPVLMLSVKEAKMCFRTAPDFFL